MVPLGKLRECTNLHSGNSARPVDPFANGLPRAVRLFLSLILFCPCLLAQQDVATIVQNSVQANNRDWKEAPNYDYEERDRDGQGTKTYEVTDVFGTPYERLIAINGKELSAAQKAEQQKKYDQMLAQRKAESTAQRAKRIAKYRADRRRDHEMLEQLTKAFDFKLEGEQELAGHKAYVLNATPRSGYQPTSRDTQVLPAMEGKLWIDKASYQWVKVEAHVIRPVRIEGFLAQVEPGTKFELEKSPAEGDIWLPVHYAMTASAKVLYLLHHHSQEDETYFNYHKRQNSSAGNAQLSKKDQYGASR